MPLFYLTGYWAAAWEPMTGGSASSQGKTQKLHELLAQKTHKVNRLGTGCRDATGGSASRYAFPRSAWEREGREDERDERNERDERDERGQGFELNLTPVRGNLQVLSYPFPLPLS
jgi:hypothetical protein